jgi:hypothetical protein
MTTWDEMPAWQFLRDETGTVIRERIHRWRWRTLRNSATGGVRYERGPLTVQWEHGAGQIKLGRLLFIRCAPKHPYQMDAHLADEQLSGLARKSPTTRQVSDALDDHSQGAVRCTMPVFLVRLRALPGVDGIRALRAALKVLLRRHKLKCLSVEIEPAKPKGGDDGRRCEEA